MRCWVLPGNTQDMNRVILQRAGGHYILREKLRDSQREHQEVLSHRGRYQKVEENLEVKEVINGEGERRRRFVLVYNPEQANKDKATRERTLERLREALSALGDQRGKAHKKAVCSLLSHRTLGRYLKQEKTGVLKIDWDKVRAEERLDGKYLLSTSDDTLTAEEVALGYKQLMEVERAFRTLNTTLELRPLYHRKDEWIRAHVLLCFLALLLVRIAEQQTGQTWDHIRAVLERIHLGEFESRDGRVLKRTELTPEQANLLKTLNISPPPKIQRVHLKG